MISVYLLNGEELEFIDQYHSFDEALHETLQDCLEDNRGVWIFYENGDYAGTMNVVAVDGKSPGILRTGCAVYLSRLLSTVEYRVEYRQTDSGVVTRYGEIV